MFCRALSVFEDERLVGQVELFIPARQRVGGQSGRACLKAFGQVLETFIHLNSKIFSCKMSNSHKCSIFVDFFTNFLRTICDLRF